MTALVGATLIDGTGRTPLREATLLIGSGRIAQIGSRDSHKLPSDVRTIDVSGKWVMPGIIDTNVHLTVFGQSPGAGYETLVRYGPANERLALESAQLHLKYGVTAVRDSYGVLPALLTTREMIERGSVVGPRVLAAGNIVGWGGPFSVTFGAPNSPGRPRVVAFPFVELTRFQQEFNDVVTQGTGEELLDLDPDELAAAIDGYLDKGPQFIKYGGTGHFAYPDLIPFSAAAQRVIVDRAHRRGLVAETHATSAESLRQSIDAGVDLIQHPEILRLRELPDDIIERIRDSKIVCSLLSNTITGPAWERHKTRSNDIRQKHDAEERAGRAWDSAWLQRRRRLDLDEDIDLRRHNAQRLIAAGCVITIGTDNQWGAAPEFRLSPKPDEQEPGLGTLRGLEGLVDLGMSPSAAIVAATRNGAIACRQSEEFGTLEVGRSADLIVLDGDPLSDITNVRRIATVMVRGALVDLERLPENPIFSRTSAV